MDISSYIVSVSMAMHQTQFTQNLGIAVAKKALDVQDSQAAAIADMLGAPTYAGKMDILA